MIGDLANRVRALSAGQVATVWVAVVSFAALAVWQYSEMPERDRQFAMLPSEQVTVAQRDLADASRAESVSRAQAESTMALIGRLATSNKNGFVPTFLLNTAKHEAQMHSIDSSGLASRALFLRIAEDQHRTEIEQRARWTRVLQGALLAILVVLLLSAIVATFVWFGRQARTQ